MLWTSDGATSPYWIRPCNCGIRSAGAAAYALCILRAVRHNGRTRLRIPQHQTIRRGTVPLDGRPAERGRLPFLLERQSVLSPGSHRRACFPDHATAYRRRYAPAAYLLRNPRPERRNRIRRPASEQP